MTCFTFKVQYRIRYTNCWKGIFNSKSPYTSVLLIVSDLKRKKQNKKKTWHILHSNFSAAHHPGGGAQKKKKIWVGTVYVPGSFHMKSPDFQKSSHMTLLDFLLISLKCYPYSQTEWFQISGPCVFSFSRGGLRKLRCRDLFFTIK